MHADITTAFEEGIRNRQEVWEAIEIVKSNSNGGKIWLIGWLVYDTIVHQLYRNTPEKDLRDIDIIVEHPKTNFVLPPGWTVEYNRFWNPKFVCGTKKIDYIPLEHIFSILQRKLAPTIENYLLWVPLSIQSIAYDITDKKIIGDIGIKAIENKTVEVLDKQLALYAAEKKWISLQEMIREKSEGLWFINK